MSDHRSAARQPRALEIAAEPLPAGDGRNVDSDLGVLSGEAAEMQVRGPARAFPLDAAVARQDRNAPTAMGASTTYYDLPVIKRPVWKSYISIYFYVGGVAGASAALGAAAQLSRDRRLCRLVHRTRWIAAIGAALSAALLIADLGRPSRFLNMLRVFRPTSPMNLGTWILTAFGAFSGAGALFGRSRGFLGSFAGVSGIASGAIGLPLTGYTAVLLTNTTVPVWKGARWTLPVLFVASAASSAASLMQVLSVNRTEHRVLQRLALTAKLAELIAAEAVDYELEKSGPGPVAKPLSSGRSGALWATAKLLMGMSLGLDLVPSRGKAKRVAAGLAGTLGSLVLRFAITAAGRASADDPRATFEPQRASRDARALSAAPPDAPTRVPFAIPQPNPASQ